MTMCGTYGGYGCLDLAGNHCHCDDDCDEKIPETSPVPGTASLSIEDRYEALFTSADWSIVARVGNVEVGRSSYIKTPHSDAYVKQWTRQLIRSNKVRLRRLGVDVDATYQSYGGTIRDLED